MRLRLPLAGCLLAMSLSAVLAAPSMAQRGRVNSAPPQHTPPPKAPAKQQQQRQQQRQQERNAAKPPQHDKHPNGGSGNPQGNGAKQPDSVPHSNGNPNGNPNRPPSAYTPPQPQKKFSDLPPQDKQRVLENYRKQQNLTPAQRQEIQDRKKTWDGLTPEQQSHIKNDVLPKWRQMPLERRQAIRQRLRVLQNMPESAKNQRLNDPNFTRGMSEEDRVTLRDLSHMHVGAPDPPGE
jgi:hypothetical protein